MEHKGLLNINFWRVLVINLLVSSSVYMLMPIWPYVAEGGNTLAAEQNGWAMILFGVGLFLPGSISSYLLDKYRRKDVLLWSVVSLMGVSVLSTQSMTELQVWFLRLVQGCCFGLFHIALGSTILIDITSRDRRDETSYVYYWGCKFALGAGPLLGVLALTYKVPHFFLIYPLFCLVVSLYLLIRLQLPFKTPNCTRMFSADRFWLPRCQVLAVCLFLLMLVVGAHMSLNISLTFFGLLFAGFAFSLLAHFVIFYRADKRAEIVSGLACVCASSLLMLFRDDQSMVDVACALLGYGMGSITGRLQWFFTQVSEHCDRGSAQSTYKLTFEFALCLGFMLACTMGQGREELVYEICVGLSLLNVLYYLLFASKWFLRNRVR